MQIECFLFLMKLLYDENQIKTAHIQMLAKLKGEIICPII